MSKDILKARYFSHDCNARNDEKLMSLRMDHGAAGYGVYFMLLERCGESVGYTSAKDLKLIAFDLREDQDLIRSVIDDYNLFKLSEDGERFYSESFLERMAIKDKHSINGIKGNLIRYKHATKEQLSNMSDKEIIALNNKIVSDATSGARSGPNRNKEKEKEEKEKEKKEREKGNSSDTSLSIDPLEFLRINFKKEFSRVLDPLMKGIKDPEKFRKKFNNTVLNELDNGKLKSDPKSLLRRLENYAFSWVTNEESEKQKIVNGYSAADVDKFYKK